MFIADPATADLVLTALCSAGVISLGIISLFMLPWTDQEIAQVDRSARQFRARFNDQVRTLGEDATSGIHRQVTRV